MTEIELWSTVSTLVQAGGTTAVLIGIVLAFWTGRLVTGSAYEALRTDCKEWVSAYKAAADAALRLQQELAIRRREDA